MPFTVPPDFLWGASTSGHQTEGGNVSSDWWVLENAPGSFVSEPSLDAVDSFHRWGEDMDLLAAAGFTDYRFSVEWARIEPLAGRVRGPRSRTIARWCSARSRAGFGRW